MEWFYTDDRPHEETREVNDIGTADCTTVFYYKRQPRQSRFYDFRFSSEVVLRQPESSRSEIYFARPAEAKGMANNGDFVRN